MPKPIVVALDPDREDDAPLFAGAALASLTAMPMMVVGAYQHDPITSAASGGAVDAELRAAALSALEARTTDVDADLLIRGGSSAGRVLHDAAVELGASLLVVGSTRRSAVGRLAPGSTAERLLHGSSCPVVVAPRGMTPDWAPHRIAVGFVDLEDGHGALRVAAGLAGAAGTALRAVTAVGSSARSRPGAAPSGAERADASRRDAEQALRAAIAQLPADITVTPDVVAAHPVDALADVSADVDLLICGSRGYGPLRAVLLGGVTHALVSRARCPVLIVPRGTEQALTHELQGSEAATAWTAAR